MIQTAQNKAALRSLFELKDATGSAIDLYFGPTAPAGHEAHWIKTSRTRDGSRQSATLRFSLTPSCGPATIRGCIHTRAPKAGMCWRESSVWRLRLAPAGLGPEKPRRCERILQWNSTSLVRRSGVRSPWSSMIRLRSGAYPLTGNRPEPVVNNDRSRSALNL